MTIIDEIFGPNGPMAANVSGYAPREGQIALANAIYEGMSTDRHVLAEGPCGCHVAGQGILMANGKIKAVEDICVGDEVMGPDSRPRHVLELVRGEQETVTVTPIKGEPWTVNLDHVLTLVRYDNDSVQDVTVREFLTASRTQKSLNKLFRVPVTAFHGVVPEPMPLDPYFLGVLLGDGSMHESTSVGITKADPEIEELAYTQAQKLGLRVRVIEHNNTKTFAIVGELGNKNNPLIAALRVLGLRDAGAGDKFVPYAYKVASVPDRLAILAGIMDTDGSLTNGSYDYISKSQALSNDVAFLARSLGMAAYVKECEKSCQGGFTGTYYRVCISGDINKIPCRIPRKQAGQRKQQKDPLRTGFTLVPTGKVEPYYGFVVDGDHRYLLSDFTVTHNCGKTFAYTIPAIVKAAKTRSKVVIATANIALQEQLIRKDLPAMSKALGKDHEFTYALLKGVNNYLCLNAMKSASSMLSQRAMFQSQDMFSQFSSVMSWAESTKTGDVNELDFIPQGIVWQKFSTTADDCLKRDCPAYQQCFAMKARQAARDADVIVTNYHMLFAHLAVVAAGGEGILPAFDILVCDEAHEAADIAREFFGINVSQGGVNALASMAASEIKTLSKVATDLKNEADIFFNFIIDYAKSGSYKIRLKQREFVNDSGIVGKLEAIAGKVEEAEEQETDKTRKTKLANIRTRAANAAKNIREVVRQDDEDSVYWIEIGDKGTVRLRSKPVYVHDMLRENVFDAIKSVTCISATMTTGDAQAPTAFEFIRKELGCPEDCIRVVGPSPFDFGKQALAIVPMGLPSPKDRDYGVAVALSVEQAVKVCGGRVLGLFTSYKNMNLVYEHIARTAGVRVLRQGDMPRQELLRIFKEDKTSVLLGTDSFWTGVDVPGDACVCVVIDRLPFGHAEDPVVDAISSRDKGAFTNYHIPRAVIDFRQGVGRLIRTKTDVGAVVVLDNRVISTPWGNRYFWASMPRGINARQDMNMIPGFLDWAKSQVLHP